MANEFVIKNGYFSQGNSNVTGSVAITQNVTASKALFSSSNGNQLTVMGSGSTIAQVYGSQGNLLTVNDTFSGSIFTVTDISGYPILDVTSDYYTSSINTVGFLNHTGSARVTGSLIVSGGFIVYNTSPQYKAIDSALSNLYYSDGEVSVGWADSFLKDTDNAVSINWNERLLIANNNETIHIDWDNPSYMNFPSVNTNVPIVNVLGLDINGNLYATASTAFGGGESGTPGGLNKQVQFNGLGGFSGSSNFTFDSASNTVEISGSLTVSGSGTFTNIGPARFTGSVSVTQGGFTGSLFGTSSYVSGSIFTSTNPALSASYALTASHTLNGGASGVSSLTVGTGLLGSSTTGDITLNLSATAYTTYANNTAATATPSLVTFKEVGEQAMVATITWNGTSPGGTTNLRYRWFQIGNMVQYFFFFNYGTQGNNNSTITFDFPSDMPTPTPPTGTGATSTYIYRGSGLGQVLPTAPSTAAGSGFWGGGIRRDSGNTKYEFFFSVGSAITARAFYHSGFYFV
jgi:hypothetical protein